MPGALGHARSDTPLADLSIDSLDAVELLCLIDEEFDVRLEQGSLETFATVGELADAVAARGASVRHR
jgi:acyl carrier protein